ncbi:MAG: c-type cytochrome [bacterium]|nr:MAG: c-type cytochrome [bacterium]
MKLWEIKNKNIETFMRETTMMSSPLYSVKINSEIKERRTLITVNNRLLIGILFLLTFVSTNIWSQSLDIPENPLKGRYVFEQKGCITCHAIKGEGGHEGPDLGRSKFYGSFLQLASIMWNHTPQMLQRMRELDLPYPQFSQEEMVNLISYLYYLRYLGEPGNLYRGKILVTEKGCLNCHSIGGKGENSAPAFDHLSKYISPLYLAQSLWNHGPEMDREIRKRGLTRPKFENKEIVDLSAYIREATKGIEKESVYMSPGNPKRGKIVFSEKGCTKCHSVKEGENSNAPNLGDLEWDYSVTEIAGLMWNHGAEMGELMEKKNIKWPVFDGKEIADLIAYLYFIKFEDKPGNPGQGEKLFTDKGCTSCHNKDRLGPTLMGRLRESSTTFTSIDMAQVMWNHAPVMEERVLEKTLQWPKLTGNEMIDLYAFLTQILKNNTKEGN